MIRKEMLSSRKFHNGIALGVRGTVFAWLLSLLVGCAIPSASTPAHSSAQEVVVQPFSNNRAESDSRPTSWLNRMISPRQRQESQARSTNQQPVHASLAESQPTIQQASYQQDTGPRIYSTPSDGTAPANETFYREQENWGYANGSLPPRRGPVYPPPARQMSPGHFQNQSNHGQPVGGSIDDGGATQRLHPSQWGPPEVPHGYVHRESPPQSYSPRDEQYELNTPYLIQPDSRYEPSPSSSAVGGRARGHYSQGPALQGSSLNPAIRTATEIAGYLQRENGRLSEAFSRTQKELENKKLELEAAREELNQKDQELAKASLLEENLLGKIRQLKAQLQIAEQQKSELRRQSDATLKEIESTLDEALFQNFSKRDD